MKGEVNKTSYRKVKQRLLVLDKKVDPSSVGCAGRRFSACICKMGFLIYTFCIINRRRLNEAEIPL